MNMDNYVWTGINACQYLGVLFQVDTVFKWIQFGLAIICSGILLAYRIWKWHKDASKDGNIDKEEIDQLVDIVKDGAEEIKSDIDKFEK